MFHQGDLQSGIGLAIQEAKSVACFVRDDGEESDVWEHDWLQDEEVSSLLAQTTVLLRMEAGSTEAGFLAAFCPLKETPTLVVIHNGQLREHLTATDDLTKDQFTARLQAVLSPADQATASPVSQLELTPAATPPEPSTTPATTSAPQPSSSSSTPAPTTNNPATINTFLAERAARLEKDKAAKEAAARTKAKGKAKAVDSEGAPASSTKAAQLTAAAHARKRKEDEKNELARIQALIENDRAERKARDEEKRKQREEDRRRAAGEDVETSESAPHSSIAAGKGKATSRPTGAVHLNIRLFDGGTIRSSFTHDATLQTVREWIDEELAATGQTHPPYTFKHILPPAPSRAIEASEEAAELADIDLAPSATLVLVPVVGYTEAYSLAPSGIVGTAVGGVKGVIGSALGLVGGVLGYVTGYGAQAAPSSSTAPEGRTTGESTATGDARVRTLADQRQDTKERKERDGDRQFYNGNQTNFEPRRDEGKDD